jgi:hypothetical protein
MTIVKFPKDRTGWCCSELQWLVGACGHSCSVGDISGWDTGVTELGEPQFYVIGPPPEHDCLLVVSRLGRLYVLEDGKGAILLEHDNPALMAEHLCAALRRQKLALTVRLALAWCAVREFLEEKVEPIVAEPIDVISHYGPYVASLV